MDFAATVFEILERSLKGNGKIEINGDIATVKIIRGSHSGAKLDLHIKSPNLLRNLENYFGVDSTNPNEAPVVQVEPEDNKLFQDLMGMADKPKKESPRSTEVKVEKNALVDSKGNAFDPDKHEIDAQGNPVKTRFGSFKIRKDAAA